MSTLHVFVAFLKHQQENSIHLALCVIHISLTQLFHDFFAHRRLINSLQMENKTKRMRATSCRYHCISIHIVNCEWTLTFPEAVPPATPIRNGVFVSEMIDDSFEPFIRNTFDSADIFVQYWIYFVKSNVK